MQSQLIERLRADGCRARVVSSRHIDEIKAGVQAHLRDGALKPEVFDDYGDIFNPSPPADMPDPESLIVVAIPQAQTRFTFNLNGTRFHAVVPPTYLYAPAIERRIKGAIRDILGPGGYRAVNAVLPRKLLAVCSGLASYGRNNITYADGLGSFYRICAYYSDMPCEHDTWREPAMMPRCETCTICADKCPVGAIDPGRFLIRAEKCITYHNERDNNIPFPEWLDPSRHNCLVGCLICQRACPEDRDVIEWTEDGVEFTEDETRFLLDFDPEGMEIWTKQGPKVPEGIPAPLAGKLEESDLLRILEIVPRNLAALYGATVGHRRHGGTDATPGFTR